MGCARQLSGLSVCRFVGKLADRSGDSGPGDGVPANAGARVGCGRVAEKEGSYAGLVVYPKGKTANARARVPASAGRTKKVCSYRDGGPARRGGETTGAGWVRRARE